MIWLALAERAYSLVAANCGVIGAFAGILSLTGDQDRANSLLGPLRSGEASGAPAGLVNFHLMRRETEVAAGWFARAIEQREHADSIDSAPYVREPTGLHFVLARAGEDDKSAREGLMICEVSRAPWLSRRRG